MKKLSPDGKLLKTLGESGHRGDWDEEKGQRLLWEPVMVDFLPNGDMFIFEGHANESPNDVDGPDPTNRLGVARVIHLDKNQKFINQWFGECRRAGEIRQRPWECCGSSNWHRLDRRPRAIPHRAIHGGRQIYPDDSDEEPGLLHLL